MENLRVCVVYFPWFYTDIFQQLFQRFEHVTIIENNYQDLYPHVKRKMSWDQADVLILSLDSQGSPDVDLEPHQMQKTLLIAFPPQGNYALQRRPKESQWEIIRPFGFEQLMQIVQQPWHEIAPEALTCEVDIEENAAD